MIRKFFFAVTKTSISKGSLLTFFRNGLFIKIIYTSWHVIENSTIFIRSFFIIKLEIWTNINVCHNWPWLKHLKEVVFGWKKLPLISRNSGRSLSVVWSEIVFIWAVVGVGSLTSSHCKGKGIFFRRLQRISGFSNILEMKIRETRFTSLVGSQHFCPCSSFQANCAVNKLLLRQWLRKRIWKIHFVILLYKVKYVSACSYVPSCLSVSNRKLRLAPNRIHIIDRLASHQMWMLNEIRGCPDPPPKCDISHFQSQSDSRVSIGRPYVRTYSVWDTTHQAGSIFLIKWILH